MKSSNNKKGPIDVAKDSAKTVIDTLNPNDRVAVISFSSGAEVPGDKSECFKTNLAMASPPNKKTLKEKITKLSSSGHTKYDIAFKKAFEIFKYTKEPKFYAKERSKLNKKKKTY